MSLAGGLAAAVGSALCNGTFGTMSRLRRVQRADVPPPIFSFWHCIGIVISSLLFLPVTPRVFSPWGLLSGIIFVLAMASTFLAIQRLGLGSAAGVWCGVATLVSFTFAVKYQGDKITSPGLAAPGLMLLVGGLVTIAFNGQASYSREQQDSQGSHLLETNVERSAEIAEGRLPTVDASGYPLGLAAAVVAGFCGGVYAHFVFKFLHKQSRIWEVHDSLPGCLVGLVLAPMNYADEEAKGLQFIPSMALGVLLSAPLVAAASVAISDYSWSLYFHAAALPGLASGTIWNAGNALSIVATRNPKVGLAVAYPIMQAGLFVAGLWGILLFGELKMLRHQVIYWLGGGILIVGALMLAFSK